MIKVALTKGRIEKSALELLAAGGYDVSELEAKGRKLIFRTGNLEIVLAKAADVITYIDRGVCDVGFVGSDTINEYGGNFYEMLDLGFGVCRFALAGIKGEDFYSGRPQIFQRKGRGLRDRQDRRLRGACAASRTGGRHRRYRGDGRDA